MERLRNSNRESHKRQKLLQTQVRSLLDERADLLLQIQDQTREISVLRRSIGFGESEPVDLAKTAGAGNSHLSSTDLKDLLMEQDRLKSRIKELEIELKQYKPVNVPTTPTVIVDVETPKENK